jgi:serine/threonine protein kinase
MPGKQVDPSARTVASGDLGAASEEAGSAAATLTGAALPRASGSHDANALKGRCFAHFRIEKPLGRGGMGDVYLATDVALDRPVALKLLKREVAQNPQFRERFIREARAQARISHPHVCHIYFIGEQDEQLFFAMEYVEGESLQQRLERLGKLPPDEAIEYTRMAALGLKEAHRHGFTHRDVKPSNLLLDRHGIVKVVDFGIVKETGKGKGKGKETRDPGLTQDGGGIVGTPLYMAPEQARGEPVDHRADIYALGATLHHLVSGAPPFEGDTPLAIISKHLTDVRPRLAQQAKKARVSRVDAVIDEMMAKRTADRFADYDSLIGALDQISARTSRPAGAWVRAAAAGIDLFALLLLLIPVEIVLDKLVPGDRLDDVVFPVIAAVYTIAAHAVWGRTAGKALLEIEVVRTDGRRLGWFRSAIRWLAQWGPTYLFGAILTELTGSVSLQSTGGAAAVAALGVLMGAPPVVGGIVAGFAEGKRAPWDRISRTQVRYRRLPRQ